MQLKPIVNESAVELRKLMVAFEKNLMALDALNVKGGDPYLIRFLCQKLDQESRKQWELHCPGTNLETLDEFKDFINKRVRALESNIDPSTQTKGSQKTTSFSREIHRQKTHFPASQSYKATIETCPCCNEAHKRFMCKKFESLNVKDKKNVAYNSKLCFNCLSSGHVTKDCKSKSSCKKCQVRHNTLLHVKPHSKNTETSNSVVLGPQGTFFSAGVLPNAIVTIEDQASNTHTCRALLDTGSQINLISEEAAQRMGLKREKRSLKVNVVGDISKTHNSGLARLHLKSKNYGKSISTQAFVLPKLTQNVPSKTFLIHGLLHMKTVELADPTFNKTGSIDLILGSEIIEDIFLDGKFEEPNGLKFRNTMFGWVASGKHPQRYSPSFTTFFCINETFDLKKFWELEELPPAEKFLQEEIDCEKHFKDTTKVVDNKFTVQMPFKANSQKLGDTYVQAKGRFLSLERRLHANDKLKQDYTHFVNEFITLEHLEKVPEEEYEIDSEKVKFLSYHCVHKEDSTTTFVANRVSEIQQTLPRSHWNHVRSTSNPADLSSRGSKFTDFKISALWWNGPDWLAMPSDTWQKTPLVVYSSIRHKVTEEEKNRKPREDNQPETVTTSLSTTITHPIFDENVYSTLHKLFRVIATVKTAISRFKKDKIPSQISSQLLQQAKLHFLISHHTTHFHDEYSLLQAQKELPKTSKLLNPCPFFGTETDTIRVAGRLSQGNFLEEKKFPFLVKANSNFASLILQHVHEATLHGGGQLTLNTSPEEYWIPKGKSLVTKIIKELRQM